MMTSTCYKRPGKVVIHDEETPPLKRKLESDFSPQVKEMQVKLARSETMFRRWCHAAREAELRAEQEEKSLDSKRDSVGKEEELDWRNEEMTSESSTQFKDRSAKKEEMEEKIGEIKEEEEEEIGDGKEEQEEITVTTEEAVIGEEMKEEHEHGDENEDKIEDGKKENENEDEIGNEEEEQEEITVATEEAEIRNDNEENTVAAENENNGDAEFDWISENKTDFELLSPMGGKSMMFKVIRGEENRATQEELNTHIKFIHSLGMLKGFTENVCWPDLKRYHHSFDFFNERISAFRERYAANPSLSFSSSSDCDEEQAKNIISSCFSRVIASKGLSLYASWKINPSLGQIHSILERLNLTDEDMFVELCTGIGSTLAYTAALTTSKCVGIEMNFVHYDMTKQMQEELEGMMSWYGKEYRTFDLIDEEPLGAQAIREASVVYVHNYTAQPTLTNGISRLCWEMQTGTRIVCTQKGADNGRQSSRLVGMMLNCDNLPLDDPVCWSCWGTLSCQIYTVNHSKPNNSPYRTFSRRKVMEEYVSKRRRSTIASFSKAENEKIDMDNGSQSAGKERRRTTGHLKKVEFAQQHTVFGEDIAGPSNRRSI